MNKFEANALPGMSSFSFRTFSHIGCTINELWSTDSTSQSLLNIK